MRIKVTTYMHLELPDDFFKVTKNHYPIDQVPNNGEEFDITEAITWDFLTEPIFLLETSTIANDWDLVNVEVIKTNPILDEIAAQADQLRKTI